jgi:uncharacterized protein YqeY
MNLKERIQTDFVKAMKSKDVIGKRALSSLKAKITEAEKANKNVELGDAEIIKVITSAIKQRTQSHTEYVKFGRIDLADVEMEDINVLETYLPAQMSREEIREAAVGIMNGFSEVITNPNALIGKTIGEFNKQFVGRADMNIVRTVVHDLVLT